MIEQVYQIISEDDFDNIWGCSFDGEILEYDDVKDLPLNTVWSVTDCEGTNDIMYASAGFHVVNMVGYVTTKKPWVMGNEVAIYFEGYTDEEMEERSKLFDV